MGLAVHSPCPPHPHPFAAALEGVFNHPGRRPQSSHGRSGAGIEAVSATAAAVVLHFLAIVQTTSPILDDGFALAMRATHRSMTLYSYILAVIP
jgi:hypothetical protein